MKCPDFYFIKNADLTLWRVFGSCLGAATAHVVNLPLLVAWIDCYHHCTTFSGLVLAKSTQHRFQHHNESVTRKSQENPHGNDLRFGAASVGLEYTNIGGNYGRASDKNHAQRFAGGYPPCRFY